MLTSIQQTDPKFSLSLDSDTKRAEQAAYINDDFATTNRGESVDFKKTNTKLHTLMEALNRAIDREREPSLEGFCWTNQSHTRPLLFNFPVGAPTPTTPTIGQIQEMPRAINALRVNLPESLPYHRLPPICPENEDPIVLTLPSPLLPTDSSSINPLGLPYYPITVITSVAAALILIPPLLEFVVQRTFAMLVRKIPFPQYSVGEVLKNEFNVRQKKESLWQWIRSGEPHRVYHVLTPVSKKISDILNAPCTANKLDELGRELNKKRV